MKWLACLTLSLLTLSAAPPAGMHFVTSVEGVSEYKLDNGLQVLVFPDPSKPTITVIRRIWSARVMRAPANAGWRICSST